MDDNSQIIDFASVTLIRGENGTGKSTINESLKFFYAEYQFCKRFSVNY